MGSDRPDEENAAGEVSAGTSHLALDHVAVAVDDLDAATVAWTALGLVRSGRDETVSSQGVRVRTLALGEASLELLEPVDETGPVARFLARRGPGLHHVALRVDDLDAEIERLEASGWELIDRVPRRGRAGSRVAFIHPRSTGGTLVELVESTSLGRR